MQPREQFEGDEAVHELSGVHPGMMIALVAAGGCVGAVLRYLVEAGITRVAGDGMPWGTLVVNVTGAFALGLLFALVAERSLAPEWTRAALGIGLLGSYTTFSTLAMDAVLLAEGAQVVRAGAYVLATNAVGIAAAVVGVAIGRST